MGKFKAGTSHDSFDTLQKATPEGDAAGSAANSRFYCLSPVNAQQML
jgi:hypothetical protein